MSYETLSPNMNLPVPGVSLTDGPQWASDLNSCLSLIDSHTHASGSGVQITPDGMNINSDLPIQNNNLVSIRSSRFTSQASPLALAADLNCVYVSGVDLYYNDGNGNQVRITQSGGVAGSPGSIANLTAPASASYVSGRTAFVWQSAANTSADMDFGSAIMRNNTVSSFALTLSPPSLSSNYGITLPFLPASQKFMTLDASGNMSAPWAVDNSTLEIASSTTLQIKDSGVTWIKRTPRTSSTTPSATGDMLITTSSGTVSNTSTTPLAIVSGSLVCSSGPVKIEVVPDGGVTLASWGAAVANSYWRVMRNGGQIAIGYIPIAGSTISTPSISVIDSPGAGTQAYELQIASGSGGQATVISSIKMIAYQP